MYLCRVNARLTSVNKTHRNVELGQVEFASVINIGEVPRLLLDLIRFKPRENLPDLHEIVLTQTALTKDVPGHLTRNESITLGIPSPEDLVIILLLLTRESPRNLGGIDRRILQKRLESLLQRLR